MSNEDQIITPNNVVSAGPAGQQTEVVKPAEPVDFDGPFDADRAKALIEALRGDKAKQKADLETLLAERDAYKAKVDQADQAALSEQEKIAKALEESQKELADVRRQAALKTYDLPESALVFLTATSAKDIEAQASALAGLAPKKDDAAPKAPADSRAKPALPNGQQHETPEPFDPKGIASAARNGGRY